MAELSVVARKEEGRYRVVRYACSCALFPGGNVPGASGSAEPNRLSLQCLWRVSTAWRPMLVKVANSLSACTQVTLVESLRSFPYTPFT